MSSAFFDEVKISGLKSRWIKIFDTTVPPYKHDQMMHLHSTKGDFTWDSFSWVKLIRLAEHYGWQPADTTIPESELKWMPNGQWNGNYTTNDGQTVTLADARSLAAALDRAVRDIPSENVIAQYREPSGGIQILPNPPNISDLDWFCGPETKDRIREFVSFCYAGEFQIS